MPLWILVILVIVGLSAVIGTVHLSGGSSVQVELSEDACIERFAIDCPQFKCSDCILSDNADAALLLQSSGAEVGLVAAMGSNVLTRLLTAEQIRDVETEGDHVTLRLRDFTLPKVQLQISETQIRKNMIDQLHKLIGQRRDA